MAKASKYKIKHLPEGLNDPYQNFDYERNPRNPLAGDPVIIKCTLTPSLEPGDKLELRWSLNGKKQEAIPGRKIIDFSNKREYYQFELGSFQAGEEVEYWIEIEAGAERIKSQQYSFIVGRRYRMESLKDIICHDNVLELSFLSTDKSLTSYLYFYYEEGRVRLINSLEKLNKSNGSKVSFIQESADCYRYRSSKGEEIEICKEPLSIKIKDQKGSVLMESVEPPLTFIEWEEYQGYYNLRLNYKTYNKNFYGFGEKYDHLNQQGLTPDICVYNQYLNQQNKTYIPIPFFWTTAGYGFFIDSNRYLKFDLAAKHQDIISISAEVSKQNPQLNSFLFFGTPVEIIKSFFAITAYPQLPPKWAFGPWMSANGWRSQAAVEKQLAYMQQYEIPATVLVIEAWSDEATFYIFNDAQYKLKAGQEAFNYEDFTFPEDGRWPDPKGMVQQIHEQGLKLILWQIPVIRELEEGMTNPQHDLDEAYVIAQGYCVQKEDGSPYRITDGWFANSLLLDFNNPEAREWWFNKRRYLIEELGVDGFKTDGGEFIFDYNLQFADGQTGAEMRNQYPLSYIQAYHEFIGENRITFSRAGFTGLQKYPLYWGGDQDSLSFETLKKLIIAGLSMNISGNPFWGWDIGGFSGEIPTAELFIRSAQMATFCPVMQFHSENYNENEYCWDRSPWNIAARTGDQRVLEIYRKYANLRMNLLPYIYDEALHTVTAGEPLMRPLVYAYPEDELVYNLEDEYLFGRKLLVAPITEEGGRQRIIYLPEGKWFDFWTGVEYQGRTFINYKADLNIIPVFIKGQEVIPLNLNSSWELGGKIGNKVDEYENLSFFLAGEIKDYTFRDDLGNEVRMTKGEEEIRVSISGNITAVYLLSLQPLCRVNSEQSWQQDHFFIYKILKK